MVEQAFGTWCPFEATEFVMNAWLLVGQLVFVFMVVLVLLVAIFPRIMYDPIKHSKRNDIVGRVIWSVTL